MLYGTASTAGPRKSAHVKSPSGRRQQRVQRLLRLGLNPPWQDVLRFLADEIDAWKQRPQFATLMKMILDVLLVFLTQTDKMITAFVA